MRRVLRKDLFFSVLVFEATFFLAVVSVSAKTETEKVRPIKVNKNLDKKLQA